MNKQGELIKYVWHDNELYFIVIKNYRIEILLTTNYTAWARYNLSGLSTPILKKIPSICFYTVGFNFEQVTAALRRQEADTIGKISGDVSK